MVHVLICNHYTKPKRHASSLVPPTSYPWLRVVTKLPYPQFFNCFSASHPLWDRFLPNHRAYNVDPLIWKFCLCRVRTVCMLVLDRTRGTVTQIVCCHGRALEMTDKVLMKMLLLGQVSTWWFFLGRCNFCFSDRHVLKPGSPVCAEEIRWLPRLQVVSLILSDVVEDHLDVIASGPTVPNRDDPGLPLRILDKYALRTKVPQNVLVVLNRTLHHPEPLPNHAFNVLLGNNKVCDAHSVQCRISTWYSSC